VNGVGIAQVHADIDQRHHDQDDEPEDEANSLAHGPGIDAALGGRIEHREAEGTDEDHEQQHAPGDLPELFRDRQLGPAERGQGLRPSHDFCVMASFWPRLVRAGLRRCVSSMMSWAMGPATAEPPPPCSTTIDRAYRGAATGAKQTNRAWSRCCQGSCSFLRTPDRCSLRLMCLTWA